MLRRSCIILSKSFPPLMRRPFVPNLILMQFKHVLNRGQHRGKKRQELMNLNKSNEGDDDNNNDDKEIDLEDHEYDVVASNAMHVTSNLIEQRVLVLQPYIKWGPKKGTTKPEYQLNEANALVRSIPTWKIIESMKIGMESLDKKALFGSGKIEELKDIIGRKKNSKDRISMVFVSKGMLQRQQKTYLEQQFGVPVLDRYSVVIQILRLHATSAEAKLQVRFLKFIKKIIKKLI